MLNLYTIKKVDNDQYELTSYNWGNILQSHCKGTKEHCIEMYNKNFDRPYSELQID